MEFEFELSFAALHVTVFPVYAKLQRVAKMNPFTRAKEEIGAGMQTCKLATWRPHAQFSVRSVHW